MSPRDRYNQRHSPADLDQPPPAPVLEFDYTRPWPTRHFGKAFGPSMITNALKGGFYVLCELADTPPHWPQQWAVDGARWQGEALEIHCLHGGRLPTRIWTI